MSIWVRKIIGSESVNYKLIAADSWDLTELVSAAENWVNEEFNTLDPGDGWIIDIGFSPRPVASGGGPILSPQFMRKCADGKISIYLSEYNDDE